MGTYDVGKSGKREHRGKVPPEPKDVSRMYERQLIEHGFKWSPVKVYRKKMQCIRGDEWRLKVSVHQPQRVCLSRAPGLRAHRHDA